MISGYRSSADHSLLIVTMAAVRRSSVILAPTQGRGLIALHGPCLSNVVHQPVIVRGIRIPPAGNSQVLMILDHMARSDRDISVSRMDAVLMNFLRQALWQ